jgi:4-hydroxy-3-methylbut-2-enyl diphosphate reductase
VTAGASAPEVLVREILERLRGFGVTSIEEVDGEAETTVFRMPAEFSGAQA